MKIRRAVILAGGMGTRIREETEFRPKPMVEIGGMPILWHIMKNLHTQGIEEFVICLGYKGEQIKDFFQNYETRVSDLVVDGAKKTRVYLSHESSETWKVTLADTGLNTMTGGRINRVRKYLNYEPFLCTYGDGLANVDLLKLYKFHESHGKIATLTAVHPATRFGNLAITTEGLVTDFSEKPPSEEWVNGGFFIFNNGIFDYLNDDCVLEQQPLRNLVSDEGLAAFKHEGFWRPMDTYRESKELNDLFETGAAPWVNWPKA
jgi:glucose-1-phosphate cytidylyltransferase